MKDLKPNFIRRSQTAVSISRTAFLETKNFKTQKKKKEKFFNTETETGRQKHESQDAKSCEMFFFSFSEFFFGFSISFFSFSTPSASIYILKKLIFVLSSKTISSTEQKKSFKYC